MSFPPEIYRLTVKHILGKRRYRHRRIKIITKTALINIYNMGTGLEKVSFHPNPKERQCKKMLNYRTVALISHTSNVMPKILQARLQQYVNCELPDVQAGFRKDRVTRDQTANICWIIKKAREFQRMYISALLTMPKRLTVWITINCGKF